MLLYFSRETRVEAMEKMAELLKNDYCPAFVDSKCVCSDSLIAMSFPSCLCPCPSPLLA